MVDGSEHTKAKGTRKCVIKQDIMFENYTDHNKDLKAIIMMFIPKNLIRLR